MHYHLYYLAVLPATGMAILGYLALYCAKNSQGSMQTAGKILAGWAFLLVLLIVAVAVFHPVMGEHPWGGRGHFGAMGDGTMMDGGPPVEQAAPTPDTPPTPKTPDGPGSSPSGWKTE
jgi:hypothetical protein